MNITECIQNDYLEWKRGDVISISAGTGSGKSYFVQNVLAEYAKSQGEFILYLVPRLQLKKQIEKDLEKECIKNIDVRTYQSYESIDEQFDMDYVQKVYKYVVCDEAHYFFSDAVFNSTTDISFERFMNNENAITLLLSATSAILLSYIKKFLSHRKLIDYNYGYDFNHVKKIEAYQKHEVLIESMNWLLEKKHKTIIFIQSAKKAYELYEKYKEHSVFVCGKESSYYKHVNEEIVDEIIKARKFNSLFLITTAVLDVGVNIEDADLHKVIIDMSDIDTVIQCLGRKRLVGDNDYVHLLIRNHTNQSIGGYIVEEKARFEEGQVFYKEGREALATKNYRKGFSDIIYVNKQGMIDVNKMKYVKASINYKWYLKCLDNSGGYLSEIKKALKYEDKIEIRDLLNIKEERENILKSYVGKELIGKESQKELLQQLGFKKNRQLVQSMSGLSKILVQEKYVYKVNSFRAYRIVDGVKIQCRIYVIETL